MSKMSLRVTGLIGIALALAWLIWTDSCKFRPVVNGLSPEAASTHAATNKASIDARGEEELSVGRAKVPKKAERRNMTRASRLLLLQRLGCVPDDPDISDYFIAEYTTWWGKRLDPEKFWKGRPIWYDSSAEFAARRRGRGSPPIPPGVTDPKILSLSDKDRTSDGFSLSGSQPSYVASEREGVFWKAFYYTHPHPPSAIEDEQKELARWLLKAQWDLNYGKNIAKRTPQIVEQVFTSSVRDLCKSSFPPEAFGKDALFWRYVFSKRNEYQEQLALLGSPEAAFARLREAGYVDKKYITEPLSADDIRAANAWKLPYLRRLRQEKADESYINAYMQAWNLSSNEVWSGIP